MQEHDSILLAPIGLETQLEDLFFGQKESDKELVKRKTKFLQLNAKLIDMINGDKVYEVEVNDEDIHYFLSERMDAVEYYYPIQYARVKLRTL